MGVVDELAHHGERNVGRDIDDVARTLDAAVIEVDFDGNDLAGAVSAIFNAMGATVVVGEDRLPGLVVAGCACQLAQSC